MAPNTVDFGIPFSIERLIQHYKLYLNKTVRICGKIDQLANYIKLSSIEKKESHDYILVDVRLIDQNILTNGSIMQFVGEVSEFNAKPLIIAKVARCLNGSDVRFYFKALEVQMEYLKKRKI